MTDLWLAPLINPGTAQPLMKTPFREAYAKFFPDGRLLVYVSDESGRDEVYLRAFPIALERLQVSTNGGSMPVWAPDGRAIFYRTPTAMMEVAVTRTAGGLATSPPTSFSGSIQSGVYSSPLSSRQTVGSCSRAQKHARTSGTAELVAFGDSARGCTLQMNVGIRAHHMDWCRDSAVGGPQTSVFGRSPWGGNSATLWRATRNR